MKLLLSSPLLWAFAPQQVLDTAAKLEYDGVELWAYHLLRDGAAPADLRAQAEDAGLCLTLHALSWDLNFASTLPSIRTASLQLLKESADMAAELRAELLILHPGRMTVPRDEPATNWSLLVAGLQYLIEYAAGVGVTLAIEHMEPLINELVITPEDVQQVLHEVGSDRLACVFDLAHVPWQEDPLVYYQRMPRVDHIHFSDANAKQYHLPLGTGQRDLGAFLRHMSANFHSCVAIEGIEHRPTTRLAESNKEVWDQLLRRYTQEV